MSATDLVPAHLIPILEAPNYGFLGTIRPDDTVQVNPMWFDFDGETLRFTHTTKRAKYRNLQRNPSMSFAILNHENAYGYVELRGKLIETIPDPTGAYYVHLGKRYGNPDQLPPPDSADRVILVMSIEHCSS
ncbi:PPOX class F420-dependent oxidoreductase [Promicromonospora sp. NPDC023805]|uniref:PPOX class F420-dependent oxidoreductase n=1 Tax=Promicromonospora sp. NPDC023805 TaxID=3154696 RepID=UPI0033E566C9